MKYIDTFLNGITMYRLLMWGLAGIAGIAVLLGFVHALPFGGVDLLVSFFLITSVCYGLNVLCAKLYDAPRNVESVYITAFILFFLLDPTLSVSGVVWLIVGSVVAILSKYVIAYKHKHLFNPAAFGVLTLSLVGSGTVLWWVATPLLVIPTALLGLLVVHKIRRFDLLLTFFGVSLIVGAWSAFTIGYSIPAMLLQYVESWPLLFLGTIMLTEPATTPPTRTMRIVYGAIVGGLFSAQFSIGPLHTSPALALIVGNLFAYIVSPKEKYMLTLQSMRELHAGIYEFVFQSKHTLVFTAGQYMEWTLPETGADVRGNRRYFTISSGPEDSFVRLATRIPSEHPSSFKEHLVHMKQGDVLSAGSLAGDFVLPKRTEEKVVCIAGGIGITPFISMVRDMIARKEKRDMVLFYAVKDLSDCVFTEELTAAEVYGVRTVRVAGGPITEERLKQEVPDYSDRTFYISGPNAMVRAYKVLLRGLGISRRRIKEDYFPGL